MTHKKVNPLKSYLEKHFPIHRIAHFPSGNLELSIVLPAYLEEDYLSATLTSLINCEPPGGDVEILVVINTSKEESREIFMRQQVCEQMVNKFSNENLPGWLRIYALPAYNLPLKHFGAGLARKTGLDEAVRRFNTINKPHGIIACLDADSPVDPNYMTSLVNWFSNPKNKGAVVNFEHPLAGSEFSPDVYNAITLYELHLRYYVQALRQTGFPYSFHTMGSAMAFRAETYARAGGMPRKQAGEDFYFLQKIIPMGGFGEIWDTAVKPSPRASNRVIFGTGAAIRQHLTGEKKQGQTYSLQAFDDLKSLFDKLDQLQILDISGFDAWGMNQPPSIRHFLLETNFKKELRIIQTNSANRNTFKKRFFQTFNAFRVVKYLNLSQSLFHPPMKVTHAAELLLERMVNEPITATNPTALLEAYRLYEKTHPYPTGAA